jgi:hypothetical protein
MTLLTPVEMETKNILIEKFRTQDLTVPEAQELKRILEKEQQQAIQVGDVALIVAIGLLLGTVIDYLYSKRSWFKRILGI